MWLVVMLVQAAGLGNQSRACRLQLLLSLPTGIAGSIERLTLSPQTSVCDFTQNLRHTAPSFLVQGESRSSIHILRDLTRGAARTTQLIDSLRSVSAQASSTVGSVFEVGTPWLDPHRLRIFSTTVPHDDREFLLAKNDPAIC
jgi:hypothetical protein